MVRRKDQVAKLPEARRGSGGLQLQRCKAGLPEWDAIAAKSCLPSQCQAVPVGQARNPVFNLPFLILILGDRSYYHSL